MLIQPLDAVGQPSGPPVIIQGELVALLDGVRLSVPRGSLWPTLSSRGWMRIHGRRYLHYATYPEGQRLWVELKNA